MTAAQRLTVVVSVIVCCVTLLAGYGLKARCVGPTTGYYPRPCYTDIQWDRGLYRPGAIPYVNRFVEYPPLTGTFMWFTAKASGSQGQYLLVSALLMLPFGLATAALLASMAGARALLWSAAPPLLLFGFLNWDLLVVAAAVAAFWQWRQGRFTWAAALLGLGGALKLYPLLFLIPLVLERLRAGERRAAVRCAVIGGCVAIACNVPYALASPHGWWSSYRFQARRAADLSTFWTHGPPHLSVPMLNVASDALTVIAAACVLLVAHRRAQREGVYPYLQACAGVLIAFLAFGKIYSPQYALWVLPFFALLDVAIGWWIAFTAVSLAVFTVVFLVGFPGLSTGTASALLPFVVWTRTLGLIALAAAMLLASPVRRVDGPTGSAPSAAVARAAAPPA
jgi:hypothetical protein